MGRRGVLAWMREVIGSLGWKIYIWADFKGDENRFHREKDREVIARYPYICPHCEGFGGDYDAVFVPGDQTMEEWADCDECDGLGRLERLTPEEEAMQPPWPWNLPRQPKSSQ